MSNNLMIEIALRKDKNVDFSEFKNIIDTYRTAELEHKIVLNVPPDWVGFSDLQFSSMLRHFGGAMYVALAYYVRESETVTDMDGMPVDSYDVVESGKTIHKYVKKKLKISRIVDGNIEVEAYVLDIRVVPPVLKLKFVPGTWLSEQKEG